MSNQLATKEKKELAKQEVSPSERFTMKVMREFPTGGDDRVELTSFQRKLIQNYFIKLDGVLKESEAKRYAPKNDLPFNWNNINMNKLAQDVVAYSSIGLDPLQKNHITPIPYKNGKSGKYDINFMEGYIGLELKSKIYGYEPPKEVIFELKYSTDEFKSHKKSSSNPVETYDFSITDDFNRGELEGGFYYMIYDNPEKNKLVVMNRAQIEKRKPEYASAEFWGGEKDNWEYDQAKGKNVKKGTKEVEGWEEEMFLKTLKRHCFGSIAIDSQKIHDHLLKVIENESQSNEREVAETITAGTANRKQIGFEAEDAEYEEAEEEQPDSKEDEDAENQRIMEETLAEEEAKKQPQTVYPGF